MVMQRNRELKKGRRAPTRAKHIMTLLDQREVRSSKQDAPWRAGLFRVGDTLEVEHRPSINEKPERTVGLCIARYKRGMAESFRLLCKIDEMPCEYQFFIHNPLMLSIEVRASPAKRPRTKQIIYMRERVREVKLPAARRTDAEGNVVAEVKARSKKSKNKRH